MFSSLSARPSLQGLRSMSSLPNPTRMPLRVRSVMGGYQYNNKADNLRGKGIDVKEFGSRVLREGCFGEDVLALQTWLSEETYYNPVDGGYTGYFGSVTKESLQAWQRDSGLETTGTFDAASKWHYLRCLEQRAAPAPAPAAAVAAANTKQYHAFSVSSTPVVVDRSTQGSAGTPFFAAASILTGIVLLKLVAPAIKRTATSLKRRVVANLPSFAAAAATVSEQHRIVEEGIEKYDDMHYSLDNAENDTARERASRLRRLSEEELQRYIAPMKGSAASRTPLQRPIPRPLKLSRSSIASAQSATAAAATPNEGATTDAPSKYGMYYGGKQVIDRVKQYLLEENDMPAPAGGAHRVAGAYDMRKNRSTRRPAAPQQQQQQQQKQQQQRHVSPLRVAPTPAPAPRTFEDIPAAALLAEEAQQAFLESEALLSGTDLEDEPETPMWRVPVQRSSNRGGVATAEAPVQMASAVAVAPRPVAVVKPNRGGESADVLAPAAAVSAPNPSSTVVLSHKPIKLHKPARLASKSMGAVQDE